MSIVLLENIIGVWVVRAFNSENWEQERMNKAFQNYARTSIKANQWFACLDGLIFFLINVFTVAVYWLSGTELNISNLPIGDIYPAFMKIRHLTVPG